METHQIIGFALIVAGLFDAVAARFLVGPRIAEPAQRQVVVGSLLASAAMMILLGGAFLGGVIG